jgi:hypothetical protein
VHLRRALLLFAIVLGLAAVAASISRPREHKSPPPTTTQSQTAPTIEPGTAPETPPPGESGPGSVEVTFDADKPKAHKVGAGQAATVVVEVPSPGQVSIADLGLTDAADPTTPASFDVLTSRPGRYPITFEPADTNTPLEAGTLVVE